MQRITISFKFAQQLDAAKFADQLNALAWEIDEELSDPREALVAVSICPGNYDMVDKLRELVKDVGAE